jgi:hypothetical protein
MTGFDGTNQMVCADTAMTSESESESESESRSQVIQHPSRKVKRKDHMGVGVQTNTQLGLGQTSPMPHKQKKKKERQNKLVRKAEQSGTGRRKLFNPNSSMTENSPSTEGFGNLHLS